MVRRYKDGQEINEESGSEFWFTLLRFLKLMIIMKHYDFDLRASNYGLIRIRIKLILISNAGWQFWSSKSKAGTYTAHIVSTGIP